MTLEERVAKLEELCSRLQEEVLKLRKILLGADQVSITLTADQVGAGLPDKSGKI